MHARWFLPILLCVGSLLSVGCASVFEGQQDARSQRLGFRQGGEATGPESNALEQRPSAGRNESHDQNSEKLPGESSAANHPSSEKTGTPVLGRSTPPRTLGTAPDEQRTAYGDEPLQSKIVERAPEEEFDPVLADRNLSPSVNKTAEEERRKQEQALAEVVAELESYGELDPETKRQLIADLRETKPALWQPMISIYRLALSSRQRAEAAKLPAASAPTASTPSAQAHVSDSEDDSPGENLSASLARANSSIAAEQQETETAYDPRPNRLRPEQTRSSTRLVPEEFALDETEPVREARTRPATEEDLVAEALAPRKPKLRTAQSAAQRASAPEPVAQKPSQTAGLKSKAYAVQPATAEERDLADWQAHLEESILLLEENLPETARTAEEVRRQAELRMLYLAGGDREAALRPINGISTTQQEFWSEGLFGLATYLDAESMPDAPRRAAEARRHLEAAVLKLGELSTLTVRNIAFCSKVNSYGIYETYAQDEFEPGQQVLLYAELDNFKCEETPTGFVTAVRSSYQIFDSRGVRVESHDYSTTEEICRNRRRDFFMRYFVDLPTRIYDGDYTLKITIEDLKGQTSGEAVIPFTIKEKK